MQTDGSAVAEECWRAAIPVQLRLADSEVSSLEQPPVLYFLVPRQSYLHSLVPQALALLHHLLPPGEQTPWFEHGHLPLKWGVPAGVLYDLVAAPSGELPWRLTLHFRGFPASTLPAYGGEAALKAAYFNSLKEAAFICRNSAQRVMEMAGGAQDDLWAQVLSSSLRAYRQIMGSLQLAPAARGSRRAAVPLRLYVRRGAGGYLSSYEDISCTSRPVDALAADGSGISLRQALLPLLADCLTGGGGGSGSAGAAGDSSSATPGGLQSLPSTPMAGSGGRMGVGDGGEEASSASTSTDAELAAASEAAEGVGLGQPAACEPGGGVTKTGSAPRDVVAEAAAAALDAAAAARQVLVGGAVPPLDAPLAWLHATLHAADYFLYVVVHI